MTPALARRAGMALLRGDRQRDGCVGSLPLADNLTLPILSRYRRRAGFPLHRRRLRNESRELLTRFGVSPNRPSLPYEALSGGNQQKALLAKILNTDPRLLLLDEPTRGIDVGARERVFSMLRAAVRSGAAAICASSDPVELDALCGRILHLSAGQLANASAAGS
jgi:ribose transport system ATP-binding protein